MKMDVHWIDVKLHNGETLKNLVVRGGAFITGYANDPNGESELSFSSSDIKAVHRHGFSLRNIVLWIKSLVLPQATSDELPVTQRRSIKRGARDLK